MQLVFNKNKFQDKKTCALEFDEQPHRIVLRQTDARKQVPLKAKTPSKHEAKFLVDKCRRGTVKEGLNSKKAQEKNHVVVGIGKHHYLKLSSQEYKKQVFKIMDQLEYGCMEGHIEGCKQIKVWEKKNSLFRIQLELLRTYETHQVDLNSMTKSSIHLQFTCTNENGDNVYLKTPEGNRYACSQCTETRVRKKCNVYGRLWAWNQIMWVHVEGTHEP